MKPPGWCEVVSLIVFFRLYWYGSSTKQVIKWSSTGMDQALNKWSSGQALVWIKHQRKCMSNSENTSVKQFDYGISMVENAVSITMNGDVMSALAQAFVND